MFGSINSWHGQAKLGANGSLSLWPFVGTLWYFSNRRACLEFLRATRSMAGNSTFRFSFPFLSFAFPHPDKPRVMSSPDPVLLSPELNRLV